MSNRERLLRRIAAYDFAIVELQIFLDTHPTNPEAIRKLDEYTKKSDVLRNQFEEQFGPIQSNNIESNRLAWISNPWPWDNEED